MKNFIKWLKSPKSDFLLFVIVIILINLVGQNAFFRIDLTESKAYSLSDASRRAVSTLDKPLAVKVFFTSNLNAPYNNVEQYLKDILTEYKGAANKYFSCEFFDMENAENQKLAREYGINQVQIQEVNNNEIGFKAAYMGAAFIYGDSIEILDGITSEESLEYNITTKITKMVTTADVLSALQDDVTLTLYTTPALSKFNISGFNQIEQSVINAYSAVNKKNQDKISFRRVEPTDEEISDYVQKYGIQSIGWTEKDGSQKQGVIGLVLEHGDTFRLIPLEMAQSLFGYAIAGLDELEDNIAENLKSLVSKSVEIGYITGHGERDLLGSDYESAASFQTLIEDTYTLKTLELSEDNIPASISTIVINGPKTAYTDEELYKIDQFLMRGGNIMFMIDPYEVTESGNYYSMPQYNPIDTGLKRLLEKYGVSLGEGYVFDEQCYDYYTNSEKLPMYWVPLVKDSGVNKTHPATKNMGNLLFVQNGPLTVTRENSSDFTAALLASTTSKAWTSTDFYVLNPNYITPPDSSERKAEPLAVILEGNFQSAFDKAPEAALTAEGEDDGTDANANGASSETGTAESTGELAVSAHLSSSIQKGKIFVCASSYITTPQLINDATQPISIFVRNVTDYMNGAEELCTMRTKGLSENSLTTVKGTLVTFMQIFNQYGLAVLIIIIALIIWRVRVARRRAIRLTYNADDTRDDDNIRVAEQNAKKLAEEAEKAATKAKKLANRKGDAD
ncbi:MAG: Gldg family protein [Treponemataceae bacterium]|nr:Gldg family protein [Treponemataceae bacterium]